MDLIYSILAVETQEGGCFEEIMNFEFLSAEDALRKLDAIQALPQKSWGYIEGESRAFNTEYYVIVERK